MLSNPRHLRLSICRTAPPPAALLGTPTVARPAAVRLPADHRPRPPRANSLPLAWLPPCSPPRAIYNSTAAAAAAEAGLCRNSPPPSSLPPPMFLSLCGRGPSLSRLLDALRSVIPLAAAGAHQGRASEPPRRSTSTRRWRKLRLRAPRRSPTRCPRLVVGRRGCGEEGARGTVSGGDSHGGGDRSGGEEQEAAVAVAGSPFSWSTKGRLLRGGNRGCVVSSSEADRSNQFILQYGHLKRRRRADGSVSSILVVHTRHAKTLAYFLPFKSDRTAGTLQSLNPTVLVIVITWINGSAS
jgi:hypothetical protein